MNEQALLNDFVTKELLASHELMDRVGVPRELRGERLSISQRVEVLVEVHEALVNYLPLQ